MLSATSFMVSAHLSIICQSIPQDCTDNICLREIMILQQHIFLLEKQVKQELPKASLPPACTQTFMWQPPPHPAFYFYRSILQKLCFCRDEWRAKDEPIGITQ